MIMSGHLAIVIGLSILAIFLCLAIILRKSISTFTKIFCTSLTVATVVAMSYSLETLYGWPYKTELPSGKFTLVSFYISSDEESIELWLIKPDSGKKRFLDRFINDRQPRSISIQYDENVHEQLDSLMKMSMGSPIDVEMKVIKGEQRPSENNHEENQQHNYILPDFNVTEK